MENLEQDDEQIYKSLDKAQEQEKKVKDILKAFAKFKSKFSKNTSVAAEELRFNRLGVQWLESDRAARERQQRPVITDNRLRLAIAQVVNDGRLNMPPIKPVPVDNQEDVESAAIIDGIIRNISYLSNLKKAAGDALDDACTIGFGYFRIDLKYLDLNTFDLTPIVSHIQKPLGVYPCTKNPLNHREWTECFVEHKDKTIEQWKRITIEEEVFLSDQNKVLTKEQVEEGGHNIVNSKTKKKYSVMQRIIKNSRITSEQEYPCKRIPIIPVWGKAYYDDTDKLVTESMVKHAKSAQISYNLYKSVVMEQINATPKAKWIGRTGSFKDKDRWAKSNVSIDPILEFNGDTPPQRAAFAELPNHLLQQASSALTDINRQTGLSDASYGFVEQTQSGRSIERQKDAGDVFNYAIRENLNIAIKDVGKTLLELIPHVYKKGRQARIVNKDDKVEAVNLGDENLANYDIVIDTGAAFQTRREETAQKMLELMKIDPSLSGVLIGEFGRNLGWSEISDIVRKTEEQQQAEQQQNDPQPSIDLEEKKIGIDSQRVAVQQYEAETKRMKVNNEASVSPTQQQQNQGYYQQ